MTTKNSTFENFQNTREKKLIYEEERLLVDATELVSRVMEVSGTKRTDLAQRLGRSKAFITQVLRGSQNLTLKTLADLFFALEYRLVMAAEPFSGTGYVFARQWNITEHGSGVISASADDESYGEIAA